MQAFVFPTLNNCFFDRNVRMRSIIILSVSVTLPQTTTLQLNLFKARFFIFELWKDKMKLHDIKRVCGKPAYFKQVKLMSLFFLVYYFLFVQLLCVFCHIRRIRLPRQMLLSTHQLKKLTVRYISQPNTSYTSGQTSKEL